MFSPNRKPGRDLQKNGVPSKEAQPMPREMKRRLWATVALTFILLIIWFGCIGIGDARYDPTIAYAVMIAYFVVFAALLVGYLAYNRAFVNKDVTVDMLPAEWSDEKKQAFVDDNRSRAEKSRWMMTVIIPFVVVFLAEALYLFVWDGFFADIFKQS